MNGNETMSQAKSDANKGELGLFPVIIAGGAGERLWPVSRESAPKPFIKLPDGETLMQKTFGRAAALPQVEEIVTVTNRELFFRTRDEYAPMNGQHLPLRFILEPTGRNTAPAIAAAALELQKCMATAPSCWCSPPII